MRRGKLDRKQASVPEATRGLGGVSYQRDMTTFLSSVLGQSIGHGHQLVDNDEGDPETGAQHDDLLHHRLTVSRRALRVLVKDLRHRGVRKDIAHLLDNIRVDRAD
jgi:hypothetical protein